MRFYYWNGFVLESNALIDLHTVRDWVRFGATQFAQAELYFGHGTDNPWDEAALLVLWAIHTPWSKMDAVLDARLSAAEREHILGLFQQRINERKPAAYLTGEAYFGGLVFHVDEHVLVPRSPVAELVLAGFQPWLTREPEYILDLCTGSGCIGLLCAHVFPEARVDLSDISKQALQVASRNVRRHGQEGAVEVIESDLFAGITRQYDIIVTNPPYVDEQDMAGLPREYLAEPKLALASGDDGLDFTRRMLREVDEYLNSEGLLVVEVGNSWQALEQAYPSVGFTWLELEHGGHGVFVLTKEQLQMYKNELSNNYVG